MVDFTLTEEQHNMREMAHDFAANVIRPVAWEYDNDGTWPAAIIRQGWELGLMNSHLSEEHGGVGATYEGTSQIQRLVIARETLLPRRVDEPARPAVALA